MSYLVGRVYGKSAASLRHLTPACEDIGPEAVAPGPTNPIKLTSPNDAPKTAEQGQ